jgi:hypothetical protein
MTKMINPARYIAFVDKLNELEAAAKKVRRYGLPMAAGEVLSEGFEHYSVQWDSMTARWTLAAETDDAPDLCSFNQTHDECSETDLCERCWQVRQEMAEADDAEAAYRA